MTATARADLAHVVEAAIAAVKPERLVPGRIACRGGELLLDGAAFPEAVSLGGRIVVIGGGKAAAGMAAAVEVVLAPAVAAGVDVQGLVSVPEGCGRTLTRVEVRETRPAGVNLPTQAAVAATAEMREAVARLGPDDLAIVLVTGGGSALLEEPRDGVALADLIAVTRVLAAAGADIRELNVVRQALSRVKAGGLARACGAGRLVALVLSDVIGDPLDLIASGPCMPVAADPAAALAILRRHAAVDAVPEVTRSLDRAVAQPPAAAACGAWTTPAGCRVSHVLLGSNATAVEAAAVAARAIGYDVTMRHAVPTTETAESVGRRLAVEAVGLHAATVRDGRPRAVIEGGEAVVAVPRDHGMGGRNQQTVVAAAARWREAGSDWPRGLVIASLGTDGEDGPTDAAGGFVDAETAARLGGDEALARAITRCDAYPVLAAAGGLIRMGPTGTNVADVRIVLAGRPQPHGDHVPQNVR
jgi:glycerate 2-kinase